MGISRQAVAAYELGKCEPSYELLIKIANYFGVSADYLLERSKCPDVNVLTVAKNIELIKNVMTFNEFSDDILEKTGIFLEPAMLELYVKGERMPSMGVIKVLAEYASVQESFFYKYNTIETLKEETKYYEKENIEIKRYNIDDDQNINNINNINNFEFTDLSAVLYHMDIETAKWVIDKDNFEYIKLAKDIQKTGLPIESIYLVMEVLKSVNNSGNDNNEKIQNTNKNNKFYANSN